MNQKSIKKIVFLLVFTLCIFFINGDRVSATEDGQTLCSYSGTWGTIEFYAVQNHSQFAVKWRLIESNENCGGTVDNSCVSVNMKGDLGSASKSLGTSYGFTSSKIADGTYDCPKLYSTVEQTQSVLGKYKKKFTISADEVENADVVESTMTAPNASNDSISRCVDGTEFRNKFTAIKNQMLSELRNDYNNKVSNYGYEELKRLMDGQGGNNLGNYYHSLAVPYLAQIRQIPSDIGCVASNEDIQKLIDEAEEAINRSVEAWKNSLEVKIENDENLTGEQREELLDIYEEAQESLDEAGDQIKRSVKKYLTEYGGIAIDDSEIDCEGLLGNDVLDDIRTLMGWIRIAAPILVILLGSLDFGKAVLSDDPKALSKATGTFIKRLIAAVALFLAPFIIMYLIEAASDLGGGCDIRGLF